jgi:uncharacterized protein (TIRG00374 family)
VFILKKQKWNIILVALATLIVLYFTLKDDFFNVVDLITNINLGWFVFGILIVLLYWCFQTLSLSAMASSTEEKLSFRTLFKSTIISNFFSAITPSATGGQPFQIYFLKKRGLKLGTATNLVIEQSILYQAALVAVGVIAIVLNYFFDFFPSNNILKKLVLIGFAVNAFVIFALCFVTFNKKASEFLCNKLINFLHKIKIIRHKEKACEKVDRVIESFYSSAKLLNGNKEAILKGIIYNFIALAFLYVTPIVVAYSLGIYSSIDILTVFVACAYVMLIGAFVPIPGGSGGIEFAFVSFFGYYITGPNLMAMLLIWRFLTYYLSILIGGIVVIFNKDWGK